MSPAGGRAGVLLIGYGNPGRIDDGLGVALAQYFEAKDGLDLDVECCYQLSVEDSAAIAEHELVIFADASVDAKEPFEFYPIEPDGSAGFTSHALSPEGVLALAEDVFGRVPKAFVLAIRGYEFNEFAERLSSGARKNLSEACRFLGDYLGNKCCSAVEQPSEGEGG